MACDGDAIWNGVDRKESLLRRQAPADNDVRTFLHFPHAPCPTSPSTADRTLALVQDYAEKALARGIGPEEAGAGLCGLPLHPCGGAQGVEGAAAGATARAGGVGAVGQELIVAGIGHVSVNAAGARRSVMRLDSPLAQGCKCMPI